MNSRIDLVECPNCGRTVDSKIIKPQYNSEKGVWDKHVCALCELEPQQLGEILPSVLDDIERRCERNPQNTAFGSTVPEHTARVISAVGDFVSSKSGRSRRRSYSLSGKTLW